MKISTSILNSNKRVESVIKLNRTNTSYIHIDVMDGNFVSDKQFTIKEIKAINFVTKYPMDVHLMVNDPIKYIKELKDLNISYITFHLEIKKDKNKIISMIKDMGYKVGVSIKPDTDVEELIPYLDDIDMVLLMSVEPGRGGQSFIEETVDKIKDLKNLIGERNILIEVDGGINGETISQLVDVDIAVVGSYIIKSDNYYKKIEDLLKKVKIDTLKINDEKIFGVFEENNIKFLSVLGNIFFGIGSYLLFLSISSKFEYFLVGLFFVLIGFIFNRKISIFEVNKISIKEKNFYRLLVVCGIVPFIILFFAGVCAAVFGIDGNFYCYSDRCSIGWEAFKISIFTVKNMFEYYLYVSYLLVVIASYKLSKLK